METILNAPCTPIYTCINTYTHAHAHGHMLTHTYKHTHTHTHTHSTHTFHTGTHTHQDTVLTIQNSIYTQLKQTTNRDCSTERKIWNVYFLHSSTKQMQINSALPS